MQLQYALVMKCYSLTNVNSVTDHFALTQSQIQYSLSRFRLSQMFG